ncbi:hypothetical protein I6A60_11360 [Frankia sp. AgB1.9]|uniref:FtsK/SpoIIIE domain-containing protein n=1 Tax=unclassified Frankia TaxID=2632575 RepID=UPI001931C97D|nr:MULTISPECIES: FtsK/SpoIIIE domain-containing protein [unclassified Frankia]MBL7490356.1 hypothetical protein [Frankia sp. AgW1.1]MBL7548466.1 hypothetical protein [Frankia sp. AgB1.9]MBL7621356.1 hypothetical protein [Frankia sp. AgB1.8]
MRSEETALPLSVPVDELVERVQAYELEIASQRALLRGAARRTTERLGDVRAQVDAIRVAIQQRQQSLGEVTRQSGVKPDGTRSYLIPIADLAWLRRNGSAWVLRDDIGQAFDNDLALARRKFEEARIKTFGGIARRAGAEALGSYAARITRLRELITMLDRPLRAAEAEAAELLAQDRARAVELLVSAGEAAELARDLLPAPWRPWTNPAWERWAAGPAHRGTDSVYAGILTTLDDPELGDDASLGSSAEIPFFLSGRQSTQIIYTPANRDEALGFARSYLLRLLAVTKPADLRFCLYDPVGLGQSVASLLELAEYDADLIGGKVWSTPDDLTARLTELTAHIELVIQKYLRTEFDSIQDFNAAAGEVAEPYRLLVLFDVPTGLTERAAGLLRSIVENGPRCGVQTLVLVNAAVAVPHGVDLDLATADALRIYFGNPFVLEHDGYKLRMLLSPETDAGAGPVARRIIDSVGRQVINRTEQAVTFTKSFGLFNVMANRGLRTELSPAVGSTEVDDLSTWWRVDSTRGIFAPIGQKGAREAAILGFDSEDQYGALLVGRPGSGKSTLLHTYLAGLTTLYGPDELELYLVDFKEGVEFKHYAAEKLPHARVIAIESDREFGISVLESLRGELSRRGELFRATGGRHSGLRSLRETTGEALPRVLLVFDEFQVLLARNDRLGLKAADLLEHVVRQGRGFGVHVLLGSQSLDGLDALGAHVPQLLPTRILLAATQADAHRVLGEKNDAGQYLSGHGEGILNSRAGAVEANERFRGALLSDEDRLVRLQRLRAKADAMGFTRLPTIFEGNAAVPLDRIPAGRFREELAATGRAPIRLRVGVPMATAGTADLELRREAGANVLAVLRDPGGDGMSPSDGPAYGLLTAAVASAAQSQAQIDVIDFLPVDDGLDDVLQALLGSGRITLRRRRAFAALVTELAAEVADRVDSDDALRQARLAFLFGVHRARDLDAEMSSLDADQELADALENVLRDGPEVGVHVIFWADTVGGASRRLSPRMIRECGWRIAGHMSADDSHSLLGSDRAAEIRDRQLVIGNDERGIETRALTFGLPSAEWLADILASQPPSPNRKAADG